MEDPHYNGVSEPADQTPQAPPQQPSQPQNSGQYSNPQAQHQQFAPQYVQGKTILLFYKR